MLSKQGFIHHLKNIEEQAKWVEYYSEMPELAEVAQKNLDLSRDVLINHFEETERPSEED
jgi:hypothetical protein